MIKLYLYGKLCSQLPPPEVIEARKIDCHFFQKLFNFCLENCPKLIQMNLAQFFASNLDHYYKLHIDLQWFTLQRAQSSSCCSYDILVFPRTLCKGIDSLLAGRVVPNPSGRKLLRRNGELQLNRAFFLVWLCQEFQSMIFFLISQIQCLFKVAQFLDLR